MPRLPAHMIVPAFLKLSARAKETHAGFPAFLNYVTKFWMEEIGPEKLSVYGLRKRTNKDVEANNSKFILPLSQNSSRIWARFFVPKQ